MNLKEQLLIALAAMFTPKMQNSKQRLARMRLAGVILVCSLLGNVYFLTRLVKITVERNDIKNKLEACSKHDHAATTSNTTLNQKLYTCETALTVKAAISQAASAPTRKPK